MGEEEELKKRILTKLNEVNKSIDRIQNSPAPNRDWIELSLRAQFMLDLWTMLT